jgi:hypothetical protein
MLCEHSILIFLKIFENFVCTYVYDALRAVHKQGGGNFIVSYMESFVIVYIGL